MSTLAPRWAGPSGSPAARPGALSREGSASLLRVAVAAAPHLTGNARPWRLRRGQTGETLELHAKPSRALRNADPSGRIVHIAAGAALFNLRLAAALAGREPVTRLLPSQDQPPLLATVRLSGPHRPGAGERELYAAIGRRISGGPFVSAPVPASVLGELTDAAALEGAILDILDASASAGVLVRAAGAVRPAGMTGAELTALPWAWLADRSQLAVLSASPRTRAGWLRTGQALQRVLLLAAARSLAAAPLSPLFTAPDHRLVSYLAAMGIEQPQIILRLKVPGLPLTR
jgi:hypothetical protein